MTDAVVIIVNYESGELLSRCLDSVLSQEPAPARVLVMDNASPSGFHTPLPEGVTLLQRSRNDGFSAALLDGLAASSEPFVLTLNPDTRLLPGCLAALTEALDRDLLAGSVAPRVLQAQAAGLIDASGIGLTSQLGQLNWDHGLRTDQLTDEAHDVLGPLGGAALWRRIALERAGGFDPRYFLYWEDIDIALRLNRAGYECRTVPSAEVLHEGSAITGRYSRLNVFYMVRNHWPCLMRALPGRVLRNRALWFAVGPLRAATLYGLRGRPFTALWGLLCGAALVPGALLSRRHLSRTGSGHKAAQRLRVLMRAADENRRRLRSSRTGGPGR